MASRASIAPETDLGVVAPTQVTEEIVEQTVPEIPVATRTADPSDIPSIDAAIAQPATEESAGDLPVIGSDPESVPMSDGSGEDKTGGDGS